MANEEHVAIPRQGVDVWNAWRKANPDVGPDLHEVNLSGANLSEVDLREADLSKANLSRANLSAAYLSGANLSEANLSGADFFVADLRKARKAELRDNRRKLFPIRLVDMDTLREWECFDADTGKDLAVEVREYFIPVFTRWKNHDSFERAFAKLLDGLKAVDAPPVPRTEPPKPSGHSKKRLQNPQTIIARKKPPCLERVIEPIQVAIVPHLRDCSVLCG